VDPRAKMDAMMKINPLPARRKSNLGRLAHSLVTILTKLPCIRGVMYAIFNMENEMSRSCSTHGRDEKYIQCSGWKI
jgi:hypothetical protein